MYMLAIHSIFCNIVQVTKKHSRGNLRHKITGIFFFYLQCWLSIVGCGSSSENYSSKEEDINMEKKKDTQVVDRRLHARFSRAVSEMQFLGFIRPSKRKTDHVERLTF
jgi:hypothetical protein